MNNYELDLQKTKFANDEELKSYLITLVLQFASYVNNLDFKYFSKDNFQEFKENYLKLFNNYCTEKRKQKGSKVYYISSKGRFGEIEKAIVKFFYLQKRQAEIGFFPTVEEYLDCYKFDLRKENNIWRINNIKNLQWKDFVF